MNTRTRACLFGGTMLAAGMTAPALAGEFTIGDSFSGFFGTTPGAYTYAGFAAGYDSDFGPASGPASFGSSFTDGPNTNTASIILSATELSGEVSKPVGVAGGNSLDTRTGFTIDSTMDVMVEWDVDVSVVSINRQFQILDADNGDAVVFDYFTVDPASGSATVTLDAGTNYTFLISYSTFNADDGNASFRVLVPAPGAAALLGLAGIAGLRRRR